MLKSIKQWIIARSKENSTHKGVLVLLGCIGAVYFLFVEKDLQLAFGSILLSQSASAALNVAFKEPHEFKTLESSDLTNVPEKTNVDS